MKSRKNRFLSGRKIVPAPIPPDARVTEIVDKYFHAYNAGRLREACSLFTTKMLEPDVTVGHEPDRRADPGRARAAHASFR